MMVVSPTVDGTVCVLVCSVIGLCVYCSECKVCVWCVCVKCVCVCEVCVYACVNVSTCDAAAA